MMAMRQGADGPQQWLVLQLQTESKLLMIDSQTYKTQCSRENSNHLYFIRLGKTKVCEGLSKKFLTSLIMWEKWN